MGGGLMQLVAYGAQDIYLTGNPQITFSRLYTEDIPTSLWNLLNKLSMELLISVSVLHALFPETVI